MYQLRGHKFHLTFLKKEQARAVDMVKNDPVKKEL